MVVAHVGLVAEGERLRSRVVLDAQPCRVGREVVLGSQCGEDWLGL